MTTTDPDFYRRTLDYLPSPAMVVAASGELLYANHALYALGGWTELGPGQNVIDIVHPDDLEMASSDFAAAVESPTARILGRRRAWAPVLLRLVAQDGRTLHVQVLGAGGVFDPTVKGIIYTVTPAEERMLIGRLLDGLSRGASMHHLLSLVATILAAPPLDLEAAILQSTCSDTWVVAASTSAGWINCPNGPANHSSETAIRKSGTLLSSHHSPPTHCASWSLHPQSMCQQAGRSTA